jgi:hypothetical protein
LRISSKTKDCKIVALPKVSATTGNIASLNNGIDAPFDIRRIFYIYDIPSGADRGAHAHIDCHQLLVAITGSFEVEVFDGSTHKKFSLNQPDQGLHIPPGIWASEINFSGGGICLVLASLEYDEADYIRDMDIYLNIIQKN